MQAIQMQPKRQAFGQVNGNTMPAKEMQQGPAKPSGLAQYTQNGYQLKGHAQPPAEKHAPPQQMPKVLQQKMKHQAPQEKMVIIEVVRPSKPDTVHAEVARGMRPMGGSAPSQSAYSTHSSNNSESVSVGKTISVKETTFIMGPITAQTGSIQLHDVKAKVQIQPPTPFNNQRKAAHDNQRRAESSTPMTAPAPVPLPAASQHSMQSRMVEQWLENQQPPTVPRSENDDERSTRSLDIQSVYDFEVTNTGTTRNSFNKMPAPGTFMQGAGGEGPGLVC